MKDYKPKNQRTKYKVRVLHDDFKETVLEGLDWPTAVDRFVFYVRAALELNVSIRCVNIMNGKGSIRMYSNH